MELESQKEEREGGEREGYHAEWAREAERKQSSIRWNEVKVIQALIKPGQKGGYTVFSAPSLAAELKDKVWMRQPTVASREAPLGHSIKPCPIPTPLPLPPQTRSVQTVMLSFSCVFCQPGSRQDRWLFYSLLAAAEASCGKSLKWNFAECPKTEPGFGYAHIIFRR